MKPPNFAPIYVGLYPGLAEICRANGYALAAHGSAGRDFDLIAVPWVDDPKTPNELIDAILAQYALTIVGERLVQKGHGRLCTTMIVSFGECFLDFSIMEPKIKSDIKTNTQYYCPPLKSQIELTEALQNMQENLDKNNG
jgi:hypothetical protein